MAASDPTGPTQTDRPAVPPASPTESGTNAQSFRTDRQSSATALRSVFVFAVVIAVVGAFTLGAAPVLADGHDFDVSIGSYDETVTAGEDLTVVADVTNANAGNQATETVTLAVAGNQVDSATTGQLDQGESASVQLSYATTESDVGEQNVEIGWSDGTASRTVDVVEDDAVDVTGTVTDAETGEELENASIKVDDQEVDQSGSDGSFGVNEDDTYTLTVEHADYETYEEEIQGDEDALQIELEPLNGSIAGDVVLAEGTSDPVDVTVTVDNGVDSVSTTDSTADQELDYAFDVPRAGDHSGADDAYDLTVDAPGFDPVTVEDVVVEPNEDVALSTVTLGGENASLAVALEDETGDPLTGVDVTAASDDVTATEQTGGSGEATFDVAPGEYDLSANPPNYDEVTDSAALDPGESETVTLTAGAEDGAISGTVELDGAAISETDVTVTAEAGGGSYDDTVTIAAGGDESSFSIDGVPASDGDYTVAATAPGYGEDQVGEVTVSPGGTASLGSPLVLSADAGDVTVDVVAATDGAVIEGADVTIEREGDYPSQDPASYTFERTTDAAGAVTFSDVRVGTYDVTVEHPDYADSVAEQTVHLDDDDGDADSATIELDALSGSIAGTVTLEEPAVSDAGQGLTITATNGEGDVFDVDRDVNAGATEVSYTLSELPAGTYDVEATVDGYDSAETTGVAVESNGEADGVDLALAPHAGGLDVNVASDVDGTGIEDATVTAELRNVDTEDASLTTTTATTDGDGDASFSDLRAGTYEVTIEHPEYETAAESATVADASTATLDTTLGARDGSLDGVVTFDEPVLLDNHDVTVELVAPDESIEAETTVTASAGDESVSYSFADVPATDGDYTVRASAADYDDGSTTVAVGPGESVEADDVTLTAHTGAVALNVLDDFDGSGVGDADVTAELRSHDRTPGNEPTWSETAGAEGQAILDDLRVGTYELSIDHPDYHAETVADVSVEDGVTTEETVELEGLPGTIEGTVVRDDGEPIPDATVSVDGDEVATDANGEFAVDDVERGEHDVVANAEGFYQNETVVTVGPNETAAPSIVLEGVIENQNTTHTYGSIQAAIDADATQDGHVVSVPNGTYDEDVDVTKGVTVRGAGAPASMNDLATGEHTVFDGDGGPAQFDLSAEGAAVEDAVFDGSDARIAIRSQADDTAVRNVLIDGHAGPGVLLSDGSGGELADVTVSDVGDTAVQLDGHQGAVASDLTVGSGAAVGVALTDGAANNEIHLDDVSASDTAISLEGASDNVIEATAITDAATGIELDEANGNEFTISEAIDGEAALSISNSDGNTFTVPRIATDQRTGLHLQASDDNVFAVDEITSEEAVRGVRLLDAHGNEFDGLTLTDFETGVVLDDGSSGNAFSDLDVSEVDAGSVLTGVQVREATDNTFENTEVDMEGDTGLHLVEGAEDNEFSDTLVRDADVGAHLVGADGNEFDGIDVDVGDRPVETAVLLEDGADGNHVGGLTVLHERSVTTGVEVLRSADNVIAGAALQFADGDAVVLDRADNTTVVDSTIDRSGGHGVYLTGLPDDAGSYDPVPIRDVTVRNTTVTNGAAHGIYLDGDETAGVLNTTIVESTLADNADSAVRGTYAHEGLLEANAINENGAHAVQFTDAEANAFVENQVSSNATDRHGVLLIRSPDTTMDGDVVTDSQSGVVLREGSDDAVLTEVTASDNADYGVWVTDESTNATIRDGWTEGNTHGILFDATDIGDHDVLRNTVANNTAAGVSVDAVHGNQFHDNDVVHNGDHGLHLDASNDNLLADNDVADNAGSGVVFLDAENNTATANDVTGNDPYGFFLGQNADENEFVENVVTGNAEDGVKLVDSRANTFTDDEVTNNGVRGVAVTGSSSDTVLTGVTASDNAAEGVHVTTASSATIQDGTVESNGADGILIDGTGPTNHVISSTTVAANGDHGIHIEDVAENDLIGNDVSDNGATGILLDGSGSNEVVDNDVTANDGGGVLVDDADGNAFSTNDVADHGEEDGVLLLGASDTSFDGDAVTNNAAGINATAGSDRVTVESVVASNNDRGVHVVDSANATIRTGEFDTNDVGVLLDGGDTSHEVLANEFTADDVAIRSLDGANNELSDNEVVDATTTGIHVIGSADDLLVDNQVSGVDEGDAILVEGASDATLLENAVIGNDVGVRVTAGAGGTQVDALEATDNDVGVLVRDQTEAANVTETSVTNGTFTDNSRGVVLDGTTETQLVSNNSIEGGDVGIELLATTDDRIEDNEVSSALDVGISLVGTTNADLVANDVTNVQGEGGTGIALAGGSNENTVLGGIVTDAFVGISIEGSDANRVETVDVSGTLRGVALADAENNTLANNDVHDGVNPSAVGIELDGTGDTALASNQVTDQGVGIEIDDAVGTTLVDDTVAQNADVGVLVVGETNDTILENLTAVDNGVGVSEGDVAEPSPEAFLTTGGVVLESGTDAVVANGSFDSNSNGVLVFGGDGHVVSNTTMTNQLVGVGGFGKIDTEAEPVESIPGTGDPVTALVIEENELDGHGIGVGLANTTGAVLTENLVANDIEEGTPFVGTGEGVTVSMAGDTTMTDNVVEDVETGVQVAGSDGTSVTGLAVSGANDGLLVTDATSTTIEDVSIAGTDGSGLVVDGATDTHVTGGTVVDSGEEDVLVLASEDTTADGLALANEMISFAGDDVNLTSAAPVTPGPNEGVSLGAGLNATNQSAEGWIDLGVHYDEETAGEVDEDSLAIHRFSNGTWSELDSDVDTDASVVSATVQNFSHFGAFGSEPSSDPSPEPDPEPEPAGGGGGGGLEPPGDPPELLGVSVDPTDVEPGASVVANATYDGVDGGAVNATLSIDGNVVDFQRVYISEDATQNVTLTWTFDETGAYDVGVAGEDAGTVTVQTGDADGTEAPGTDVGTATPGDTTEAGDDAGGAPTPDDGDDSGLPMALLVVALAGIAILGAAGLGRWYRQ